MKRYDFDELTKHECDDGEWVKASEAEAEIAKLKSLIEGSKLCFHCKNFNTKNCTHCKRRATYVVFHTVCGPDNWELGWKE